MNHKSVAINAMVMLCFSFASCLSPSSKNKKSNAVKFETPKINTIKPDDSGYCIAHVYFDKSSSATLNYYFKNDRIIKVTGYDTATNATGEVLYIYDKKGSLKKVVINDSAGIIGTYPELEENWYGAAKTQKEFLDSLRIYIPLYWANPTVLGDISYLLATDEGIVKDSTSGAERMLAKTNINQTFRFYPSELEGFINEGDYVNEYTIHLHNDTLTTERIVFDKGILTREYKWKNDSILLMESNCKYNNQESFFWVKKIVLQCNH